MSEKATLVDVSKCMACRACQVACKQWNQLPAETTKNVGTYENPPDLSPKTFTRVLFIESVANGQLEWLYRKTQCMHCNNAACVKICPVNARAKNELGFIEINIQRCIGCGLCVKACPFDAPRVDNKTNKATGCWFCLDRVLAGMEPACVKTCPTDTLKFGDRSDMLRAANDAISKAKAKGVTLTLYGGKEFGGTHVLYLLPHEPALFGLPEENKAEVTNEAEAIAYLDNKLKNSPIKDAVVSAAMLKYFGKVKV